MTRKTKTRLAVVLGVSAALSASAYHFRTQILDYWYPERNFNVLLISIDAARADRFAFNGYQGRLTPNLEQLVETALVFKQAYCYSGSTAPSMAAIFTSKVPYWPPEGPFWDPDHIYGLSRFFNEEGVRPGIPAGITTLPTILKKHGYATVGISTNPYLTKDFAFDRGFDLFEEFSSRPEDYPYAGADQVAGRLQLYLSGLRNDKFFAWIHLMDLHMPLKGYEPFLDAARARRATTEHRALPVAQWTEYARKFMRSFGEWKVPNWTDTEEALPQALEAYLLAYDAELVRIDEQIGVIIDTLRLYGLLEKTIVAVVNDHGDEFMEHGDWTHRGRLYQEIVRGFWIMSNPTLFSDPVMMEKRVSHVDFVPTLLDLMRLPRSPSFDGVSQWTATGAAVDAPNGFVFGVLADRAYVIDGDYKLIIRDHPGQGEGMAERDSSSLAMELYNLSRDPAEQRNVAENLPKVTEKLFTKLKDAFLQKEIAFWADVGTLGNTTPGRTEISKETEERLKALGYVQ